MLHWRAMRRRSVRLGWALIALMATACDSPPTSPIDPSFTAGVVHESFSGSLAVLGFRFYSFNVPTRGNVDVTLLSLTEGGAASSAAVLLTVGVPRGTDCIGTNSIGASAGATPQLGVALDPGIYCVRIADNGTLTAPVNFSITITRPQ